MHQWLMKIKVKLKKENDYLYAWVKKNIGLQHLIGTVVGPSASVPPSGSPHVTPTKASAAAPGPPPTASEPDNKHIFGWNNRNLGGRFVVEIPGLFVLFGITLSKFEIQFCPKSSNDLDLPPPEEWLIKSHGSGHGVLVCELDVGKALRVPVELVAQDCHLHINMTNTLLWGGSLERSSESGVSAMFTLLIEPQPWKCCSSSSAVAP